jgi:hypothetical protein
MPENKTVPVDRAVSDVSYARRQLIVALVKIDNRDRVTDCIRRALDALESVDNLLTERVIAYAAQDDGGAHSSGG